MSNEGKKVSVHYTGTLEDGTKFDSSYDRGEPLSFTCMAGMMIPGFDEAVKTMALGEKKTVVLQPDEAYGPRDEHKVAQLQFSMLPGAERLEIGQDIRLATADGIPMPCKVVDKDDESVTVDMNHPLAGKALTFEIELVDVQGE